MCMTPFAVTSSPPQRQSQPQQPQSQQQQIQQQQQQQQPQEHGQSIENPPYEGDNILYRQQHHDDDKVNTNNSNHSDEHSNQKSEGDIGQSFSQSQFLCQLFSSVSVCNAAPSTNMPTLYCRHTKQQYHLMRHNEQTGHYHVSMNQEIHVRVRSDVQKPLRFIFLIRDLKGRTYSIYPFLSPHVTSLSNFQLLSPNQETFLTLKTSSLLSFVQSPTHAAPQPATYLSLIVVATVNSDFLKIMSTLKRSLTKGHLISKHGLTQGQDTLGNEASSRKDGLALYRFKLRVDRD